MVDTNDENLDANGVAPVLEPWPGDTDRDAFIMNHTPKVKYIVSRIAARLPASVDHEDLIHAGIVGLIHAFEKFDPSKGIKFDTYAEFRIRGAIFDELRTHDWVSRSVRQKSNKLEKTYSELEQEFGRPATDEEVTERLGIGLEEFYEMLKSIQGISLVNLEDVGHLTGTGAENLYHSVHERGLTDFVEILNLREILVAVAEAIDRLPEREKLVIALYYSEELNMKEIGEVLSITESRVSQIHTKAVLRLRSKLKNVLEADG